MNEIIFTNHLIERLYERKISKNQVFQTVRKPDQEKREGDRWELSKKFGNQKITTIAKYEDNKIIILSAWSSNEFEKNIRIKKSGIFKKFWTTLLNQIIK